MATQGCPCGFLGHPRKPCQCKPRQVQVYRARLSGSLLDRIDMHVEVPAVTARESSRVARQPATRIESEERQVRSTAQDSSVPTPSAKCDSASIRKRVQAARAIQPIQQSRFDDRSLVRTNTGMGLSDLDNFCRVDIESTALLQKAVESSSLSARPGPGIAPVMIVPSHSHDQPLDVHRGPGASALAGLAPVVLPGDEGPVPTNQGIRRFSPTEVARFMGLPASFRFPEELGLAQRYKLLGNSLNIPVARWVVQTLPAEP